MKFTSFLLAISLSAGISTLQAQNASTPAPSPSVPAVKPPPRAPDVASPKVDASGQPAPAFIKQHEAYVETAKKGNIDLYFLGDSITAGWRKAPEIWEKAFGPWKPGNFGIGGDRTEHVLWRIENGELTGVTPKVVVLMIGTNNCWVDAPAATARGVEKIVATIREKLPETKILLLAIFPRGADANDAKRKVNDQVNAIIAKLGDDKHVFFLDIGSKFLQPDGELSAEIMPDRLHPNAKGYQIWVDAMTPKLTELMK